MNEYNLINSKAISEHCRKIKHKFNTEELAVLIYRNRTMSIDEKISLYQELIDNYPDMEVIKRIHCKHYNSVKDMIREEITRIQGLEQEIKKQDEDMLYTYGAFYKSSQGFEESSNLYKTYADVCKAINKEIQDDKNNEILEYRIIKRSFIRYDRRIIEEYVIINKNSKLVNVTDTDDNSDIEYICLNIPTPFKKGDILVCSSNSYNCGTLFTNGKYVFVLEWLCNWEDKFQEALDKGRHDSSDMIGYGYYVCNYNNITLDHIFDYDCWEYFEGELDGSARILKGISSLLQDKITLDLFLDVYEEIKADNNRRNLNWYDKEGLILAGLNEEDIKE